MGSSPKHCARLASCRKDCADFLSAQIWRINEEMYSRIFCAIQRDSRHVQVLNRIFRILNKSRTQYFTFSLKVGKNSSGPRLFTLSSSQAETRQSQETEAAAVASYWKRFKQNNRQVSGNPKRPRSFLQGCIAKDYSLRTRHSQETKGGFAVDSDGLQYYIKIDRGQTVPRDRDHCLQPRTERDKNIKKGEGKGKAPK